MQAARGETTGRLRTAPALGSRRGFGLADIRAANRELILTALEREGPLSRSALARRLGLSRTTVGGIIADLLREGRVREDGVLPAAARGGRCATLLRVCEA